MTDIPSDFDTSNPAHVRKLFAGARRFCRRAGFPVNDPEYGSAINMGVWDAMKRWKPNKGPNMLSFACRCASDRCKNVKRIFHFWTRQDAAGASKYNSGEGRGSTRSPEPIIIPILD